MFTTEQHHKLAEGLHQHSQAFQYFELVYHKLLLMLLLYFSFIYSQSTGTLPNTSGRATVAVLMHYMLLKSQFYVTASH